MTLTHENITSPCRSSWPWFSFHIICRYVAKTVFTPEDDVFIGMGLVDMYSKCGYSALAVFRRMDQKNILIWTAITIGLAVHGKEKEKKKL